jgi:DNA-binding SARP family transcriptional activator
MLNMKLLGQFSVRVNDELVNLPSRPAQSLFAYLVLNAGKCVRREKLAGVFWPDTSEANARAQLRHALWRLRTTLTAYGLDAYRMFPEHNLHVQYCPTTEYCLDVNELLRPAAPSLSTEELMGQLMRYDEFLPGFNDVWDEWTSEWREHIRRKYLVKSLCLIDRLIKGGRWTEALEWAGRLLSETESLNAMDPVTMDSVGQKIQLLLHGLMESWKPTSFLARPDQLTRNA